MRYCSFCGQPLNPGSAFCHHCGAALKTVVPETEETPVDEKVVIEEPVCEPVAPAAVPDESEAIAEEKEFLEQTHRLLRWERKAISIASKVMLGMSIGLVVLFLLIGIIAGAASGETAIAIIFILYAFEFGILLLPLGIVGLAAANKIPQYTDTLYQDFRPTYARCSSIGMIVFNYFFSGGVGLVFYVINFARMKSNKKLIDRILTRQGVK